MENPKTILVVHASDSEQHLGHFIKILDNLKKEERIASYTTLDSNSVDENTFKDLGSEDMVTVMLTNDILDSKASIESWLTDVKKQSDLKVAEILIDNIPYETGFIAFPTSLEPIRSIEDMDSVWQGIANNFEKLFPKPEIKPKPTPDPDPIPPKPVWKKYIPYILAIVALIIVAFFLLRKCNTPKPVPDKLDKFTVEGVSARANKTKITSQNCPDELGFEGIIQTNGPGKLSYRWVGSDGSKSDPETLEVSEKGKHRVDFVRNFGEPGKTHKNQWQQLEVLSPKEMYSNRAEFNLICESPVFSGVNLDFRNLGATRIINEQHFSQEGIKYVRTKPQGTYCRAAKPAILAKGTYNAPVSFLSTAAPTKLNSCNGVVLEFEFTSSVKQITVLFYGAATNYELTAYRSNGTRIGSNTKQGVAYNYGQPYAVTYTSGSKDISRITFGHQAALTMVVAIQGR